MTSSCSRRAQWRVVGLVALATAVGPRVWAQPCTPTISGPAEVCPGATGTYTVGAFDSYSWTLDGSPLSSAASVALTGLAGSHTLAVAVSQGECLSSAARTISFPAALSAVSVSVLGDDFVCQVCTGGTATVTDTGGGTATHQWGIRSGSNVSPIPGQVFTFYTINGNDFPGAGNRDLVVTTTPTCGSPIRSADTRVQVTGGSNADPAVVLGVTSRNGANTVQWLSPSFNQFRSIELLLRSDRFATGLWDGGAALFSGGAEGTTGSFDHDGLANDTAVHYSAFVRANAGSISIGRFTSGRPFSSPTVRWEYHTGAASVAPPGINGFVYVVSNDSVLHALDRVSAAARGGDWPSTWTPLRIGQPAQSRPIASSVAIGDAGRVVFLGSQDGRVYAVDAVNGAPSGSPLWASAVLGPSTPPGDVMVQASPSTIGAPLSLVLVGTRNSTLANAFFALRLATGVEAWRFTNSAAQGGTGLGMGIIGGQATVDAATSRVYFASRARAGGSPNTVWCVQLTATAPTLVWARNVGDVDGSTTLRNGRLYVGTNAGTVHALDANTGADLWTAPFATGDGAVKGFIWPVRGSTRLYFTTTNNVWAVDDAGASPTSPWAQPLAVAAPSLPLFSGAFLYVGSGDGRLYEIDPLGGTRSVEIVSGGVAGVGSPSMDFQSSVIYVGSEAGNVYSVAVPLP